MLKIAFIFHSKLVITSLIFVIVSIALFSISNAATETELQSTEKEKSSDSENRKLQSPEPGIPLNELPSLEPNVEPEPAQQAETAPPVVLRDPKLLPEPVARMRELILDAARAGDIEQLRSLIGIGDTATSLSIGGLDGDPIDYLRETSGDNDGIEILAILMEVLEAGYVHLDQGTDDEMYVWPYFFSWPIDKLTPAMKVELYRILTAGDVEDSKEFGGYIFYRVGIRPDGSWSFFVAGD